MTYKENITAILECHFGGFKEEIIDSACNRILEIEPCEYAPFTIDELKNEDMQKLLREFKNQRAIVTDHDCLPSATITEPCEDAISKASVFEILGNLMSIPYDFDRPINEDDISESMDEIRALSLVTPKARWIPCNERLPKAFEFVNCTCHSLVDDREDWVVETVYVPLPSNSPYSDWGNIPMLNSGDCEVIAWMHRDIPKPYKAEMGREDMWKEVIEFDAILIPDGATNGDMIKAMFPNAQIDYHEKSDLVDDYVTVFIGGCDTCQDYSYDWWNAPYRAESEE